jgi:hypothetical protein
VLPPASQLEAAAAGVAYMRRTYPGRPIGPHRNWALPEHATSCPGDTWASWLPKLDPQPPQEEDDIDMFLAVTLNTTPSHAYVIGPDGKRHIDDLVELEVYQRKLGHPIGYNAEELAFVPDVKAR